MPSSEKVTAGMRLEKLMPLKVRLTVPFDGSTVMSVAQLLSLLTLPAVTVFTFRASMLVVELVGARGSLLSSLQAVKPMSIAMTARSDSNFFIVLCDF